jgi:hypothetical protein
MLSEMNIFLRFLAVFFSNSCRVFSYFSAIFSTSKKNRRRPLSPEVAKEVKAEKTSINRLPGQATIPRRKPPVSMIRLEIELELKREGVRLNRLTPYFLMKFIVQSSPPQIG